MKTPILHFCFVAPQTTENKYIKHTVHQTFIALLAALGLSPCSSGSVAVPSRRDSRKWRIARRSHARLAIAARACQLEPWPPGAALWAALTRASPLYLSQADWLRAGAEKQAGSGKRSATFRGAPRWIIQTVPVATISADMFPPTSGTLSHIHTQRRTHTPRVKYSSRLLTVGKGARSVKC